ncbi:MAG: DNA (cytosine-5-)-methyltransferase [Suipraeoptans sp.]
MKKTVCELFAGVGGFRLGLERLQSNWETVWFSQWEPKASAQWAHDCYVRHFGESNDLQGNITTGIDIAEVNKENIPDHNLLVGGFPCQDYSVAHGLSTEMGIHGKKGVLWWQIYETIIAKRPAFCLFENVDRLLKSPSKQRGRDFGIMLSCLNELGYSVEWRVINAARYGAVQRRRRVFIFAYRNDTNYFIAQQNSSESNIISTEGFFARTFPIKPIDEVFSYEVSENPMVATESFKFDFCNAGYMSAGVISTANIKEVEEAPITLGEILEHNVDEHFYIPDDKMEKWIYLKGSKKIPRIANNGHEYIYSEGPVGFPDVWDKPGRTMLTSESTLNRSTHVVEDLDTHRLRLLTPVEAERLQGFDDNWTNTGMTKRMRYFCMGNALVVPMITRMGTTLNNIFTAEI